MTDFVKTKTFGNDRYHTILDEVEYALKATSKEDLQSWVLASIKHLGKVSVRRGKTLGLSFLKLARFFLREAYQFTGAGLKGNLSGHAKQRGRDLATEARDTLDMFSDSCMQIYYQVREDPRRMAPRLIAGVIGLYAGSGGIDGDGGIPDSDLLLGIEAHRSILTHSVLPGIIVEAAVHSTIELVKVIHSNLPEQHDELWDIWMSGGAELAEDLGIGVSAGLAYHLGIDATLDGGGTYKDLPASMPIEGHQAIALSSAVTEAADLRNRRKKPKD